MEFRVKDNLFDIPVNLFAVSHLHYEDEEHFIANLIDDPIVLSRAHANSEKLLFRFQFLDTVWTRIVLQAENIAIYLFSDVRVKFAKVSPGCRSDFNLVDQA